MGVCFRNGYFRRRGFLVSLGEEQLNCTQVILDPENSVDGVQPHPLLKSDPR